MNNSSYSRIKEWMIFEKILNVKFLENLSVGTELFYVGRKTDSRIDIWT